MTSVDTSSCSLSILPALLLDGPTAKNNKQQQQQQKKKKTNKNINYLVSGTDVVQLKKKIAQQRRMVLTFKKNIQLVGKNCIHCYLVNRSLLLHNNCPLRQGRCPRCLVTPTHTISRDCIMKKTSKNTLQCFKCNIPLRVYKCSIHPKDQFGDSCEMGTNQ